LSRRTDGQKWLDSIEKQKKEEAMFVTNRQTDGQTDRVNDKKIIDSYRLGAEINNSATIRIVILALFVLIRYQSVIDRQTNIPDVENTSACMAYYAAALVKSISLVVWSKK